MRLTVWSVFLVLLFACSQSNNSHEVVNLPTEGSVSPFKLFEVNSFCEGIVFDREGFGYISFDDQIVRFDTSGNFEYWATVKGANGHKIRKDGTHLVCSMTDHAVVHLDHNGVFVDYLSIESEGHSLRAPNDLSIDPLGGVYFTDPRGFNGDHELGTIHYVNSSGTTKLVAQGLSVPNGIACTVDGSSLIVAETARNRIIKFPILSPGRVGEFSVLADLPLGNGTQPRVLPDGLCLDAFGNIYVAHYGTGKIRVLNPEGTLIRSYDAGNIIVSNVAFSGPDLNQLYTTGSIIGRPGTGGVYRLNLSAVKGLDLLQGSR